MTASSLTRRSFLKTTAVAAAGAALSARSWGQVLGANGDIRVAVVGLNSRGAALLKSFRALPGVRITALCDVDTAVLERVAATLTSDGSSGEVATFVDYRDLLARPDVDAVVIATPNHLHALQAIWACQAGKDVYVEKPVSHNVWEGRQLVAAAAKYRRIVQAGTQIRSSDGIAQAVDWVKRGNLGRIQVARGYCYKRRDSIGLTTGPQPVPETVNYDLWLGPAPHEPLRRERFHYDWHWQWATGNGDVGNQGIHQMDVARWFLGETRLPQRTLSVGGRLGYEDDGETANTQVVVHEYATAPLIFEVRGLPAVVGGKTLPNHRGAGVGVIVDCEGGYILNPDYSSAQAFDRDGKLMQSWKGMQNHAENFIAAVRSRNQTSLNGQIEACHISSALCHLGNVSHRLGRQAGQREIVDRIKGSPLLAEAFGRMSEHLAVNGIDLAKTPATLGVPLTIDVRRETVRDNPAAQALLTREYRAPFAVPKLA